MNKLIPVAAALLAGGLGSLSFFRNIELDTYDRRVAATARPSAPADRISLVFIDNDSLRRMEPPVGRWPWPRLVHATVIDYPAAAGAKVIAYDVLFPERDLRKFMVADTEWTGEESDAALVDSTRNAGNVVHVAEAASAELIDPAKEIAADLTAPALNMKLPRPVCVPSGHQVAVIPPGGFCGEMSMLTGDARTATVRALEDAVVLEISAADFRALAEANPALVDHVSTIVGTRRTGLEEARASAAVMAAPEASRTYSRDAQVPNPAFVIRYSLLTPSR